MRACRPSAGRADRQCDDADARNDIGALCRHLLVAHGIRRQLTAALYVTRFVLRVLTSRSGVTSNSGGPWTISQSSTPSHFPHPSAPSLPFLSFSPPSHPYLPLHVFPFPPHPHPPDFQHFPSPFLPHLPLITAIAPPAGPGGARPPSAFLCSSQPKICKSVKSLTRVHKTPTHSLDRECCNKTFQCLISRCPSFHCKGNYFRFFGIELGGPCTRGRRDFAHPAHPFVTPLLTLAI